MKAQKFSKEIVKVSLIQNFDGYHLLGTRRDGLVTLLSREDGSISYPHLFGTKFKEFNNDYFYFMDKNNLEFLVESSTGKIVTPDDFNRLLDKGDDKVSKNMIEFYLARWATLNDEYYLYTDLNSGLDYFLKSIVKKDTLEPKLKDFDKIDFAFSHNPDIAIITQRNGKQKLYNLKTNSFFEIYEHSIIDAIPQTPFILIGEKENELRLFHIKDDKKIEPVFDDDNLFVKLKDIIKLKNGKLLINVNDGVYIV